MDKQTKSTQKTYSYYRFTHTNTYFFSIKTFSHKGPVLKDLVNNHEHVAFFFGGHKQKELYY